MTFQDLSVLAPFAILFQWIALLPIRGFWLTASTLAAFLTVAGVLADADDVLALFNSWRQFTDGTCGVFRRKYQPPGSSSQQWYWYLMPDASQVPPTGVEPSSTPRDQHSRRSSGTATTPELPSRWTFETNYREHWALLAEHQRKRELSETEDDTDSSLVERIAAHVRSFISPWSVQIMIARSPTDIALELRGRSVEDEEVAIIAGAAAAASQRRGWNTKLQSCIKPLKCSRASTRSQARQRLRVPTTAPSAFLSTDRLFRL